MSPLQERLTEYRVGRNWIRAGDVVRVTGRRGLWRFVARIGAAVELVGPDHNPRTRTFPASTIKRIAQTAQGETRRNIIHVRRTS